MSVSVRLVENASTYFGPNSLRIAYYHINTLGLHLDLSDTKEHIIPNGFNTPLCMYTGKSDVTL